MTHEAVELGLHIDVVWSRFEQWLPFAIAQPAAAFQLASQFDLGESLPNAESVLRAWLHELTTFKGYIASRFADAVAGDRTDEEAAAVLQQLLRVDLREWLVQYGLTSDKAIALANHLVIAGLSSRSFHQG